MGAVFLALHVDIEKKVSEAAASGPFEEPLSSTIPSGSGAASKIGNPYICMTDWGELQDSGVLRHGVLGWDIDG